MGRGVMQGILFTDSVTETGAVFSECRKFRYRLWRTFGPARRSDGTGGTVNFLMLNPSTADELANDPTVERCERRARAWGFGRLIVTNLFAYRATNPDDMKFQFDPVGPDNNAEIMAAALEADRVVCAWGEHGIHKGRSKHVRALLEAAGVELWALKVNASGEPGHPLYLPYAAGMVRLNAGGAVT